MEDFNSIDDMLEYISDNTDYILKSVEYDEKDPEGIKKEQDFKALQELLDEMVQEGLLVIVGKNDDGDYIYKAASDE